MRKGIIKHTRVICFEEIKDYYNKYLEYFTNKYRMKDIMGPKILIRNTTNEAGVLPSDNYIYEFLINERLLGFVYFRRNSFNNCEVIMVDLNIRIPKNITKDKKINGRLISRFNILTLLKLYLCYLLNLH